MDTYDGLEFLATKIEQQAEFEGASLADIEKKMLRFSEVEPGPLGREESVRVSEEFDQAHDTDKYEAKIRTLAQHAYDRDRQTPDGTEKWEQAKRALRGHDYYLLVMLPGNPARSSSRDYMIYIAVGIAFVIAIFVWVMLKS
jgi:hypothetical protein